MQFPSPKNDALQRRNDGRGPRRRCGQPPREISPVVRSESADFHPAPIAQLLDRRILACFDHGHHPPSDAPYELKRYHCPCAPTPSGACIRTAWPSRRCCGGRAASLPDPERVLATAGLRVAAYRRRRFMAPMDRHRARITEDIVPWATAPVWPGLTYRAAARSVVMLFGDIGQGKLLSRLVKHCRLHHLPLFVPAICWTMHLRSQGAGWLHQLGREASLGSER